jgi:eukaryotic-like serine/threonine-protein kinase
VYLSNRTLDHLRSVVTENRERYQLLEQVGRGGVGTVYAAEDTVLGRRVALKVLNAPHPESESRILARLEHPGVVPVYDAGILNDGRPFYAMKLIEGVRLDEYASGCHSLAERLRVFEKICEPVAFAHSRGVVHRDLKPSNIMIGSFGEVLVLDWGVPAILGTTGYMAPEKELGTVAADVYSLGRVLATLAGAEAPKPVAAIAAMASAPAPEARYPDITGLMADIARYLDGQPVTAHSESPFEWIGRHVSRNRILIGLIMAYLIMRAALIFFTRH